MLNHYRAAIDVHGLAGHGAEFSEAIRTASEATSAGAIKRFCGALAANRLRISAALLSVFQP